MEYYTTQSPITDPGEHAGLFDDIPCDVSGICRVVQGLIIPFDEEDAFDYSIPEDRFTDVDARYVTKMLEKIIELDDRPLTEPRPLEKRFVGCCRDFAVLFCAMARHQGIPARARVGFAPYIAEFGPNFTVDHEIAEYWNSNESRWCLVDPEQSDVLVELNSIQFSTEDIPRDQFLVAGMVWQMCRTGEANPVNFGGDPESIFRNWWFLRNRLMLDLASLNKMELLLWDIWGLMDSERDPDEGDVTLLDNVARVTQSGNEGFEEMQAFYEKEAELKVPSVITSFSPIDEPCEIELLTES